MTVLNGKTLPHFTSRKISKMTKQYELRVSTFPPRAASFPPRHAWPKMNSTVLWLILGTSPIQDAICLALSCKFTLALYIRMLDAFGRPGKLSHPVTFLAVNMIPWARIQFLRRLQNRRWKFCAQCWMLHPRSAWSIKPFWILDHKVCSYGCHTLGRRKCFLPYTGEVDMCPCSRINIHHKLRLISLCHQELRHSGADMQHLVNDGCSRIEMLVHRCTFDKSPVADVHIQVSVSLDCQDQSLRMRTRLLFDFTKSTPSQLEEFRNRRSAISVGMWVERFFYEARSSFGEGMSWPPPRWLFSRRHSWSVNDEGPLAITLTRNLGKRVIPSLDWDLNCRPD